MKSSKKEIPAVIVKTESDYIQAEHDLSRALGLNPKKFDDRAFAYNSKAVGAWFDDKRMPLPAWVRDGSACLRVMTEFQIFPMSGGKDDVFIQYGIDLESVMVQVAEHDSYELAVRYAVVVAATEIANSRRNNVRWFDMVDKNFQH